jgi:hypothetical protein
MSADALENCIYTVHTWYRHVCTRLCQVVRIPDEYVPGTYWYILEEKGTYSMEKVHTLGKKYKLFESNTSMNQYVPVHTLLLNRVLHFFDFLRVHPYILIIVEHIF